MSRYNSVLTIDPIASATLRCPFCHRQLSTSLYSCPGCGKAFSPDGKLMVFLDDDGKRSAEAKRVSDPENKLKDVFKRWPNFYRILSLSVSPIIFTGLTLRKFLKRQDASDLVLNVGSGPTRLHPRVINVDLFPFVNVDVLASADELPFCDGSMDVVCSEEVLEHVTNPQKVVAEMLRVLKPDGLIYIGVPFLFPWHPSPRDYTRWSREGLCELLSSCEIIVSGVTMGPTSALLLLACSWLSIIFSFGFAPLRKILNYVFMLMCFPFKFLDLLVAHIPGAELASAAVYVVARKKNSGVL